LGAGRSDEASPPLLPFLLAACPAGVAALAVALGAGAPSAESPGLEFVEETAAICDFFASLLCFDFAGLFAKPADTSSKLNKDDATTARQNTRITTSS